MKKMRWLSFILALLMVFTLLCAGCGQKDGGTQPPEDDTPADTTPDTPDEPEPEPESEPEPEPEPENPAVISERAMDNFLAKLAAGGYVMDAEGYLRTDAFSDDLVVFDYADDESNKDFAVWSYDNEVFQGFLKSDGIRDISFLTEGTALETAEIKLPTHWLSPEVSDGNIYNVFYNDTEDPLKFVSYDNGVKDQIRSFAGYSQTAMRYMHEVYLTFDQEDPTVAHVQCQVDDDEVARYYFDDIDISITFGGARSDERVEAWMEDPVYPEVRTEWLYGDYFMFNSVFMSGMEDPLIPFPPFASYAMMLNDETFAFDDKITLRDSHASQEDTDAYITLLKEAGYEETETEDGVCYRRLLRDETKCYASVSVGYDNGINVEVTKYYEFPTFEGLDAVNEQIAPFGFSALPDTGVLVNHTGVDTRYEATESWMYFFDYDIVLYVYASYGDPEAAEEYLNAYAEELTKNGFVPRYVNGEEGGEIDYWQSPDARASFRYHFEDDGETVILLFKSEKGLSADEANAILKEEGFPELDADAYENGRDLKKFEQVRSGSDLKASLSLTIELPSSAETEAYLEEYIAALEDLGFYRVPGTMVKSMKPIGYINEEKGLGVAFEYYPSEDGPASCYFDFKSGLDFTQEEEPVDESDGLNPILGEKLDEKFASALTGNGLASAEDFLNVPQP
ncbi:MAG: hypothetical protein K6C09_08125 [Oscillospiraceae bacterium]|nr:hypothetical protein [Oscillospiraceae bacterium]